MEDKKQFFWFEKPKELPDKKINMETTTKTLRDKILQIFLATNEWSEEDTCWQINREAAANELQTLFLEEIERAWNGGYDRCGYEFEAYLFKSEIKTRQEYINKLKQ